MSLSQGIPWWYNKCPNLAPKCHACEMVVDHPKDATIVNGIVYHKEHFVCIECLRPLLSNAYRKVDGEVYCEEDYHRLFSLKCDFCQDPIRHNGMVVLGKCFHRGNCFRCTLCQKTLKEDNYYAVNDKPYCKHDWKKYFAPKCRGCHQPISRAMVGGSIAARDGNGGEYHPECYFMWNPNHVR